MAESKLRARLKRLFSTNVIVRHAGGKRLKIADTQRIQSATKDNLVDRYGRLYTNLATGGYGKSQATSFQAQRLGLFRDYEEMDTRIASGWYVNTSGDKKEKKPAPQAPFGGRKGTGKGKEGKGREKEAQMTFWGVDGAVYTS